MRREGATKRYVVSEVSLQSDYEEYVRKFAALVVLKIVFVDILISIGDAVTDILQGVYLLGWFDENSQWRAKPETMNYGVLSLVICWVPGIICVLHILSHYRCTVYMTLKYYICPLLGINS